MHQPLESIASSACGNTDNWALRLAQRALAALLEGSRHPTNFRIAELRNTAVSALSALSVEDRGLISAWLGLQFLNAPGARARQDLAALARIDGPLAAAVSAQWPLALARFGASGFQPRLETANSCSQ
ncbi:hypothetical protein [Dokdonella sp.]|uniref:hypothetical protein n=1 Tax=Dokdonella sp. TaxID=2291710 RepID=UPI003C44829D